MRYRSLLLVSYLMSGWALAQPVPDANAPPIQQPQVTSTANGVPVVNITAPSAAGVSHNLYQQFNVDPQGAILNNAVNAAQSQLGGTVAANPNLVNGAASVIVNQVTHPNPSQLLGPLEVAGQRAHVVIANPAGITCDGCGFLNAHQATLTTGIPVINGGNLESFRVDQGKIAIQGNGLDGAQTNYTAILAKAVSLSAQLKANNLQVVSGENMVSADGNTVTALSPGQSSTTVGIDVALLGGMYANKITLVATDLGAGVHHAGITGAGAGGLTVTTNREFHNSGQIRSQGDIRIDANMASLVNEGTIYAQRNLTAINLFDRFLSQAPGERHPGGSEGMDIWEPVITQVVNGHTTKTQQMRGQTSQEARIVNTGRMAAGGNTTIRGGSAVISTGFLGAGVDVNGQVRQAKAGDLQVSNAFHSQLRNYSRTDFFGCHGYEAKRCEMLHASMNPVEFNRITGSGQNISGGQQSWQTHGYVDLSKSQTRATALNVQANYLDTRQATITVSDLLTVKDNGWQGGFRLRDRLPPMIHDRNKNPEASHSGAFNTMRLGWLNQDGVIEAGTIQAKVDFLDNTGGKLAARQPVTLLPGHGYLHRWYLPQITNANGLIQAGTSLTVESDAFNNVHGKMLADRELNATENRLENDEGVIQAGHALSIDALTPTGALNNRHGLIQSSDLHLTLPTVNNTQGTITGDAVTIKGATLTNTEGQVHTTASLTVNSKTVTNQRGQLISDDAMQVTVNHFDNDEGKVAAGKTLSLTSSNAESALSNRHGLIRAPQMTVKVPTLNNAGGRLAGKQVAIQATTLTNQPGSPAGLIGATDSLQLGVKTLENTQGALLFSGGNLAIGGQLDDKGQATGVANIVSNAGGWIDAQGKLVVNARTVQNIEGGLVLAGHTVLWPTAALSNDATSTVIAGGFTLNTPGAFTNQGRLEARTIDVVVNHFDNVSKLVRADKRLSLRGQGPHSTLDNREGVLFSYGDIALTFDHLLNDQGTVLAGKEAQWTFNNITGDGRLLSAQRLNLTVAQPLTQGPAALMDAEHLVVYAPSLENQGRLYGDRVSLAIPKLTNPGGVIAARQQADLGVSKLINREHGWVASGGNLTIGGSLDANGSAIGQASSIHNRGATLESWGSMRVTSVALHNENAGLEFEDKVVVPSYSYRSIQPKGESEIFGPERLQWDSKDGGQYRILPEDRVVIDWREFNSLRHETLSAVTRSDPGLILAGGNLTLAISHQGVNDNSQIVVGQRLHYQGQSLAARNAEGGRYAHIEKGTAHQSTHEWHGHLGGHSRRIFDTVAHPPPDGASKERVWKGPLAIATIQEHTAVPDSRQAIPAPSLQAPLTPQWEYMPPASEAWPQAGGSVVRQTSVQPMSSALFLPSDPASGTLFRTDPAFVAGSAPDLGTLLQTLGGESTSLPPRLGDGVYEQWLVRHQAMALTGQRFIRGTNSDAAAYHGLLSNGAWLGKQTGAPAGQPLTQEVIQSLDRSVVWPVIQTVKGPEGAVSALVPLLYLHQPIPNQIPSVSTIQARDIQIQLKDRLANEGRIAAPNAALLQARTIEISGAIQGKTIDARSTGDTILTGASLTAQDGLTVKAGGKLVLESVTDRGGGAGNSWTHLVSQAVLTAATPGASLATHSEGDTDVNAAMIRSAGTVRMVAGGAIHFGVKEIGRQETVLFSDNNDLSRKVAQDVGTLIQASGDITLDAGKDARLTAAQVISEGDITVRADGNIDLKAGQTQRSFAEHWRHESEGVLSSSSESSALTEQSTRTAGTTLQGQAVRVLAKGSLSGQDVQIAGEDLVELNGRQGVFLDTGKRTEFYRLESSQQSSGLGSGGLITGNTQQSGWFQSQYVGDTTNRLASANGDVVALSKGAVSLTGTDILAGNDIRLEGSAVSRSAGRETLQIEQESQSSQRGLGSSLGGIGAAGAIQQGWQTLRRASQTDDGESQTLYGIAAARALADAVRLWPSTDPQSAPGARAGIGWQSSQSHSQSSLFSEGTQPGRVSARGKLSVKATQGNIDVEDVTLSAQQIVLNAPQGEITLLAGKHQTSGSQHSDSQSSGVGVGLSASLQGVGLDVSGNRQQSHQEGQSDSVSWNPSQAVAGEQLTLVAKDVSLLGSQISGSQLTIDIQRNLHVISLLNHWRQSQHSKQTQGTIQVGLAGGNTAASASQLKQDGAVAYQGVQTQAGLFAGEKGLDAKVGGHTQLTGGVIDSQGGNNRFETGTLRVADIAGQSRLDAKSSQQGITISDGANLPGIDPLPAHAGLAIGITQEKQSSQDWVTRSGVSGNIPVLITDAAGQQAIMGQDPAETLAHLNRDTSGPASPPIDDTNLQAELSRQGTRLDALTVGGQALARTVGDIAQAQQQRALEQNDADTAKLWGEGGAARTLAHTVAGGLLGSLGNGDIAGAVAGAAVSQLLAQPTEELGKALGGDAQVIKQLTTNVASAAAGYAVGGNAGAATASTLEMYNRQLHADESQELAKLKVGLSAEAQHRLDAAACALVQCAEGVPHNDPHYAKLSALQWEGEDYATEKSLLRSRGVFMYSYTPWHSLNDLRSAQDEWATRAKGAAHLAVGSVVTVGSVGAGAVMCVASAGVGCAAGAGVAAIGGGLGYAQAVSGAQTAFGPYQSTEGAKVLASFDPAQPENRSPLVQDAIDLGMLGLEAGLLKSVGQIAKGVSKAVGKAGGVGNGVGNNAENVVNGLKLSKQLASKEQMTEVGTIIAGTGSRVPFREAERITKEYGGNAVDWVKKSSPSFTAKDGAQFETHWVENLKTGQRVEIKTKFPKE